MNKILDLVPTKITTRAIKVGECPSCNNYYAIPVKKYDSEEAGRFVEGDDLMPWDPAISVMHKERRIANSTGYMFDIDDDFK